MGLSSYIINSPLEKIGQLQREIKGSKGKSVSKFTVSAFISKMKEPGGFFQFGFFRCLSSTLFYTLYFGVNASLLDNYNSFYYRCFNNPLIATTAAMVPTFLLNRIATIA